MACHPLRLIEVVHVDLNILCPSFAFGYLRFSMRGIPHAYQGRAGTGIR